MQQAAAANAWSPLTFRSHRSDAYLPIAMLSDMSGEKTLLREAAPLP